MITPLNEGVTQQTGGLPYDAARRSETLRSRFAEDRTMDPEESAREVYRAIIRQTLLDYQHMVARGYVSRESWLVLSESGRVADQSERRGKYGTGRVYCGVGATMEDLRSALVFLGGDDLDAICAMASERGHWRLTGDDCRRVCMRWHFDYWKAHAGKGEA